ncbi:Cof-type HAD-IIB family hydrolase [Sphingomonas sp. DT-51]|uniref:Cof-type HAD-IIB family hydrolase n=1 Tax=Sphingomonas sp. DT-51 TaxID=3396165 RepID=UPI003F19B7E1
MAIRLLVSDVDGTLVDKDKNLTPGTIAAVRRLEAEGVAFTVISARPMSGIRPLLDQLGFDGDVAAFNGGIVFRRDGTIVHHETLPEDVAREALTIAAEFEVDTWLFADDRWYASDPDGAHTRSERRSSAQEPVVAHDLTSLLARADKLTFVSDDAAMLHALYARVHTAIGDRATVAQSQVYYLDVTAKGANKGDGIAALSQALGIALEDTAAIGDQANDLPMLRRAGVAIAMGNAPDAVKAAAHEVTRANDEDGVAHAIETIVLPRRH